MSEFRAPVMKLRHTIFNSAVLAIAGLEAVFLFFGFLAIVSGHSHIARAHPVRSLIELGIEFMVVLCFGGGGIANLSAGRLKRKPTIYIIIASFLSCVFIPLGVWGIVELNLIQAARRGQVLSNSAPTDFSREFLCRIATISWSSVLLGLVLVLACSLFHAKILTGISFLIFLIVLIVSLVLGIVALTSVKTHGKKGILIPALIGVLISGLPILILVIFTIFTFVDLRAKRASAMLNAASGQTNIVSDSGRTNSSP
jgi:hypothetical protein